MPTVSGQDQGRGRALHRLSARELLRSAGEPEGLKVDRDTANTRVGTWLREVANARLHATTGEIPLVRLEWERERLQPMPTPWPGLIQPARVKRPASMPRGYQHSPRPDRNLERGSARGKPAGPFQRVTGYFFQRLEQPVSKGACLARARRILLQERSQDRPGSG